MQAQQLAAHQQGRLVPQPQHHPRRHQRQAPGRHPQEHEQAQAGVQEAGVQQQGLEVDAALVVGRRGRAATRLQQRRQHLHQAPVLAAVPRMGPLVVDATIAIEGTRRGALKVVELVVVVMVQGRQVALVVDEEAEGEGGEGEEGEGEEEVVGVVEVEVEVEVEVVVVVGATIVIALDELEVEASQAPKIVKTPKPKLIVLID